MNTRHHVKSILLFRSRVPWHSTRRCFISIGGEGQSFEVKKTLPYSQARMFEIVSSVEKYHEFIPYCKESIVTKVNTGTNLAEEATLRVGWRDFDDSFDSKVTCIRPGTVIAEALNNDTFKTLYTEWNIHADKKRPSTHSIIRYKLRYQFANPIYNLVSSTFAPKVTTIMTKAFEKRAHQIERDLRLSDKSRNMTIDNI